MSRSTAARSPSWSWAMASSTSAWMRLPTCTTGAVPSSTDETASDAALGSALGESERRQRRPPSPNARSRSVSRASVAARRRCHLPAAARGRSTRGRPRQRMLGGQPPCSSSAAWNSSTASRGRPSATASSPRTKWTRRAGGLDLRAHGSLGAMRPVPCLPEATLGHIDGRHRRQCRRGDGLRRPAPRLRDRDRLERASTSQRRRPCGGESSR